jgi:type IV pilus assembly protein PilX
MNTRPLFVSPSSCRRHCTLPSQQRGVVLVIALLFLIVLTLLGVGASRMVTSEERQSRYLREYNTAFQASEAAMRDARDDIDGAFAVGGKKNSRIQGASGFAVDCSYGLCLYDKSETNPPWKVAANWLKATPYGTYSRRSPLPQSSGGALAASAKDEDENSVSRYSDLAPPSAVNGVWEQPRYLIEAVTDNRPGTGSVTFGTKTPPVLYRITSRGIGADPNSRATVQEIYSSPVAAGGF